MFLGIAKQGDPETVKSEHFDSQGHDVIVADFAELRDHILDRNFTAKVHLITGQTEHAAVGGFKGQGDAADRLFLGTLEFFGLEPFAGNGGSLSQGQVYDFGYALVAGGSKLV